MASAPSLSKEQVYLCTLAHFFVHPPAYGTKGQPLDKRQVTRGLATFLLRELKVLFWGGKDLWVHTGRPMRLHSLQPHACAVFPLGTLRGFAWLCMAHD